MAANQRIKQTSKHFSAKLLILAGLVVVIVVVIGVILLGGVLNKSKMSQAKPTLPPFPSIPVVPDELVIKYREGMSPQNLSVNQKKQLEEALANLGVVSSEPMFEEAGAPLDRYYLIHLKPGTNLEGATNAIYQLEEVEHVGPNTLYETL